MGDELVDICDENNNLTGIQKLKSEAHRNGLWHRAAHIWIYNSKGEILLQLRAKSKYLYPDMWDMSVAGHVPAGEEPVVSAVREIEEEIGLKVKKEDLELFKIRKSGAVFRKIINNEFNYVYFLKFDGDIKKLKLQDEEVQEIKFIPAGKIKQELKEGAKRYVPRPESWLEVIEEVKNKTGV